MQVPSVTSQLQSQLIQQGKQLPAKPQTQDTKSSTNPIAADGDQDGDTSVKGKTIDTRG